MSVKRGGRAVRKLGAVELVGLALYLVIAFLSLRNMGLLPQALFLPLPPIVTTVVYPLAFIAGSIHSVYVLIKKDKLSLAILLSLVILLISTEVVLVRATVENRLYLEMDGQTLKSNSVLTLDHLGVLRAYYIAPSKLTTLDYYGIGVNENGHCEGNSRILEPSYEGEPLLLGEVDLKELDWSSGILKICALANDIGVDERYEISGVIRRYEGKFQLYYRVFVTDLSVEYQIWAALVASSLFAILVGIAKFMWRRLKGKW